VLSNLLLLKLKPHAIPLCGSSCGRRLDGGQISRWGERHLGGLAKDRDLHFRLLCRRGELESLNLLGSLFSHTCTVLAHSHLLVFVTCNIELVRGARTTDKISTLTAMMLPPQDWVKNFFTDHAVFGMLIWHPVYRPFFPCQ
jgi:hypothetical protein